MTSDIIPEPADSNEPEDQRAEDRRSEDHRASGPRRNVQFGQEIGVDDTSPPQVAHGQRVAEESRMVEDSYERQRARFVLPLDQRPPAQEASEASEFGAPDPGPPTADVGLPADGPSAWDASPPAEDDETP